ncbi:hypothetical protein J2S78_002121 [Salibacterium salarium]|uniref:hypothetical protein n=1 Tax=Salibacterium salarium TaxID=284579 RepID=UPI002784D8F6|nr:hypothetical protein [Salibacterium salarium]MDQ0299701.1 hypothetical protein [Salibacterium salarium]
MKVRLERLLLFIFLCSGFMIEQTNASPLQKESPSYRYVESEEAFITTESLVDILHITDEDEYIIEWTGSSETSDETDTQQSITFLFDDGYLKDLSSGWSEESDHVSITKQTLSEDSSRYNAISFHFMTKTPAFSYDWSESMLYVFDTPMTELHSFKKPKSKEEEKSQQVLDTIIKQQQNHIRRIIKDKASLKSDVKLFPLYDTTAWKSLEKSPAFPHTHVEEIWSDIYQKLMEERKELQADNKKGMPFISWNKNSRQLSLYIHYGHV